MAGQMVVLCTHAIWLKLSLAYLVWALRFSQSLNLENQKLHTIFLLHEHIHHNHCLQAECHSYLSSA